MQSMHKHKLLKSHSNVINSEFYFRFSQTYSASYLPPACSVEALLSDLSNAKISCTMAPESHELKAPSLSKLKVSGVSHYIKSI